MRLPVASGSCAFVFGPPTETMTDRPSSCQVMSALASSRPILNPPIPDELAAHRVADAAVQLGGDEAQPLLAVGGISRTRSSISANCNIKAFFHAQARWLVLADPC